MVIAPRLFLSKSVKKGSFYYHFVYVLSAHGVCIYDMYVLSVSAQETGSMCKD